MDKWGSAHVDVGRGVGVGVRIEGLHRMFTLSTKQSKEAALLGAHQHRHLKQSMEADMFCSRLSTCPSQFRVQ
eukprot:scaffold139736_cov17-Tisochrysis_lutea.AAC.1